MIALLSMLLGVANAACPMSTVPAQPADLFEAVDVARGAAERGERPVLEAALRDAEAAVACIDTPLSADQLAPLHLAFGLARLGEAPAGGSYSPDRLRDAAPYFARYQQDARRTALDSGGIPGDLRDFEVAVFEQAAPMIAGVEEGSWREPPQPVRGVVLVNGTQGAAPDATPYVLQRVGRDDVLQSVYVHPGEPLPTYPRLRPRLAWTGVGSAVVAGGLFLGARQVVVQLESWKPADGTGSFPTEEQYFKSKQRANNVLFAGGTTFGVVSLGALGWWGATFVF